MTLATEPPAPAASEQNERISALEQWPENEVMRHVPPISWMVKKLDGDLRRRIAALWSSYASLPFGDQRHAEMELELRALCKAIDRLADVARRHRPGQHPPADLGSRITWAIDHALANLNSVDPQTFGRRYPFHTFERSNAEPLWGAMLTVIDDVQRLTELVRAIDPSVDERMYEDLVVLDPPLDPRPIA